MADPFKLTGRIDVIQGATTLSTGSDGTNFYGKGINTYAGRTVANFTYNAQMDIRNLTVGENDGSVEFDYYGLKYVEFSQTGDNSVSDTTDLQLFASLGNDNNPVSVFHQRVGIASNFTTGKIYATQLAPKHYRIEAGQHMAFNDIYVSRLLNIGTISNDEWKMYISGATNTNPPLYTPGAILIGGVSKSLNKLAGGRIAVVVNGQDKISPKESFATAGKPNAGHSRIVIKNQDIQQTIEGN